MENEPKLKPQTQSDINRILDETYKAGGTTMPNVNEPTTEEIVRALRCDTEVADCVSCPFAEKSKLGSNYDPWLCNGEMIESFAADRLESQQREIAEWAAKYLDVLNLQEAVRDLTANLAAETARADAAVAVIESAEMYARSFMAETHPYSAVMAIIGAIKEWRGVQEEGKHKEKSNAE